MANAERLQRSQSSEVNQSVVRDKGVMEPEIAQLIEPAKMRQAGRIPAVLYGDNIPEDKEIGDTESLEIFLAQAGLAMEKALLERRLRELGNPPESNG